MKTVRRIFSTDVKNLIKNFFALVIVIGVCFLPALYAWFNIYSNWDPYGNTGSLQMAAISLDKGYTNDDGTYINVGDTIMESMAENDKVGWEFVSSEDEAIEGVEDGTYYAAVVIEEDFTYDMYNMFLQTDNQPTLTFYQNQKKNPVATKISDTVISTLEQSINEEFIKVMTATFFDDANQLQADLEENGGVDALIEKMETVDEELIEYQEMIDGMIAGNEVLSENLEGASEDVASYASDTEAAANGIDATKGSVDATQVTLATYRTQVNTTINTITVLLADIEDKLTEGKVGGDVSAMITSAEQVSDDTAHLVTDINALTQSLSSAGAFSSNSGLETTLNQVTTQITNIQTVIDALQDVSTSDMSADAIADAEKNMAKQVDSAIDSIKSAQNTMNNQLIPQLDASLDSLEDVMTSTGNLMRNMSGILASMGDVFGSLQTTISASDTSLEKTRDALAAISTRIETALEKVEAVTGDERIEVLVNTLSGDPELYGQYFSEPVVIDSVAIYPVENYGSAVAPFYTTLSVWVGVIILVAIIKVKPREDAYEDATNTEIFFGRGAFFLLMGQIQTLITVLGDLYILKIQCVHPFLFWLSAAITSVVFTLLIYSLVYTFGDVGKAAAVVVLVLQIAGSSGTYPIELLPEFFQRVYMFFPFPYAINAMRECIGGLYESDLFVYLAELCIFLLPALVIGLFLRIPFDGLNRFMEKRMEDTEMM